MISDRYVAYFRVSTRRQGESGLGLDAQRDAVHRFIGTGELVASFEEIESGARADRPALDAALRECRIRRATLVIAKLDRLARSVAFVSRLQEEGVDFVAADMPHANTFTIQILAAMAEFERKLISERTVAALRAAKARGVVLGGRRTGHRIEDHSGRGRVRSAAVRTEKARDRAADCGQIIANIQAEGTLTLRGIAGVLNDRGIPAARGGKWSAGQVSRVVERNIQNSTPRSPEVFMNPDITGSQ